MKCPVTQSPIHVQRGGDKFCIDRKRSLSPRVMILNNSPYRIINKSCLCQTLTRNSFIGRVNTINWYYSAGGLLFFGHPVGLLVCDSVSWTERVLISFAYSIWMIPKGMPSVQWQRKLLKYMWITTNKPGTKFYLSYNPYPTSKQHVTVSIQLPQCNVRCIQRNICGYKTMLLHRFYNSPLSLYRTRHRNGLSILLRGYVPW